MGFLTPYFLASNEWTREIESHRESILKNVGILGADLPQTLVPEIARVLEVINSYYSNRMEGNPTRIGEVFDAAVGDFSISGTERNDQLEHVAHIQVSEFIRDTLRRDPTTVCVSRSFLKEIHRRFYQALPESLRSATARSGQKVVIEPGEWRKLPASVGRFEAPLPHQIEECMEEFEKAYDGKRGDSRDALCILAAAHHRFLWVHPFGDGNGRVVRLLTEAMALQMGFGGKTLYSFARGLARRRQEYDEGLARADLPRQGDLDGRGNLSRAGLVDFTTFFLQVMDDQILFMKEILTLSSLTAKFEEALALARVRRTLSASEAEALRWIFRLGTLPRGDVQRAAHVERRQASKIVARLLSLGKVQSDSPKGPLRLRIDRSWAQALLPPFFEG